MKWSLYLQYLRSIQVNQRWTDSIWFKHLPPEEKATWVTLNSLGDQEARTLALIELWQLHFVAALVFIPYVNPFTAPAELAPTPCCVICFLYEWPLHPRPHWFAFLVEWKPLFNQFPSSLGRFLGWWGGSLLLRAAPRLLIRSRSDAVIRWEPRTAWGMYRFTPDIYNRCHILWVSHVELYRCENINK